MTGVSPCTKVVFDAGVHSTVGDESIASSTVGSFQVIGLLLKIMFDGQVIEGTIVSVGKHRT